MGTHRVPILRLLRELRRNIGQTLSLGNERNHVHAEAVDALVQPELHQVENFATNFRIIPVEVGLLLGKPVQIVFVGRRVKLPRRTRKKRHPIVGLLAILRRTIFRRTSLRGPPDVVVAIRAVFRLPTLDKPVVLVAGVIDDEVKNQLHMPLLDGFQQLIEVSHRPKLSHDLAIVANVVSVVGVGRIKMRAQPDHIDTELLNVVQLGGNPLQVADAIPVGVLERSRIHLIDDGLLPPLLLVTIGRHLRRRRFGSCLGKQRR